MCFATNHQHHVFHVEIIGFIVTARHKRSIASFAAIIRHQEGRIGWKVLRQLVHRHRTDDACSKMSPRTPSQALRFPRMRTALQQDHTVNGNRRATSENASQIVRLPYVITNYGNWKGFRCPIADNNVTHVGWFLENSCRRMGLDKININARTMPTTTSTMKNSG